SITLFLNVFNIIFIPSYYVEILIPITIIFSIIKVVIDQLKPTIKTKNIDYFNYGLILFFGLIHGAGFSNYLKSIMGKTAQIWTKLCAFNIGIELGQIIILSFFLLFTSIFVSLLKINIKYFIYFIAVCTIFLSIQMIIQRI
ncbi:MAG: HupE/UreJ family protein, partial [Sediminibacterium sp.]|nr:HupE/UreJ family protein [Sediminibacterium sp.]